MRSNLLLCLVLSILLFQTCQSDNTGKHLFILSGQSNMAGLDPMLSFTPSVAEAFGAENIIVVKRAQSGQAIKRWYRDWQLPQQRIKNVKHDLYDTLMTEVHEVVGAEKLASITFIWMQGERDAREGWGDVYAESLQGLYQQLSSDLDRQDINFVIGRLSDFDLDNQSYPHWTKVRAAQMKLADSDPKFVWIDTDDLNDGLNSKGDSIKNDLHLSETGYIMLGRRFAQAAIQKILE